jgi:hypothetical protein
VSACTPAQLTAWPYVMDEPLRLARGGADIGFMLSEFGLVEPFDVDAVLPATRFEDLQLVPVLRPGGNEHLTRANNRQSVLEAVVRHLARPL